MVATITINVPENLAVRLQSLQNHIPQILELGLRGLNASRQPAFDGADEVLEILANLPSPEEVLSLRPSDHLQSRISMLLEKNRANGLSAEEENEWDHFQYLEHLVRKAKTRAYLKLKANKA